MRRWKKIVLASLGAPMQLILTFIIIAVTWLACSADNCFPHKGHPDECPTEIVGEVVVEYGEHVELPGYAGRAFPTSDAPVYLFRWRESVAIRSLIAKLEQNLQDARRDPQDLDKWWIVQKRREDIHKLVKELKPRAKSQTDKEGEFHFKDLECGEKYLVVVTEDVHELGIMLLHEVAGPLNQGTNRVRLSDKVGM